ncbi:MAG: glycosyltransferase [Bacteroidia bacterium]|nr:glycosyltransferase [Bacteroidia bacterium]
MKILLVDGQELVLLSLGKCLRDLGYEVKSSNNVLDAIALYDEFQPNLVITDIVVPVLKSKDSIDYSINVDDEFLGLELVRYIKELKNHLVPVMILSGNVDEDVILKGFELGVSDYMKKPLSLNEIGARVKRLIGVDKESTADNTNRLIQNNCIGVVIPCYNEESRLLGEDFRSFVHKNLGYHLCFVNDGSQDKTLEVLQELRKGKEDYISIYDCKKNGGKAEAVRLGMLHLAKKNQFDYIGFLDADLSTSLEDFKELVSTISNSNSKYKIVSGSRISRMGADIAKESARAIISKSINFIIRKTLGMEFNDTQCGAKIMNKEIIEKAFQKKFLTKWLFDVEIFMRMKKIYGIEKAKKMICEKPLNRWVHMDGSKLSFRDSFRIVGQIGQIAIHYK